MEESSKTYMEKVIDESLQNFVNSHPEIIFRYEYSDLMDCYLISYVLPENISDEDVIWDNLSDLKDSIEDALRDNPPLFSRNNIVFTLSSNAKLVKSQLQSDFDEQSFILIQNSGYYFDENNDEQVFFGSYQVYSKAA